MEIVQSLSGSHVPLSSTRRNLRPLLRAALIGAAYLVAFIILDLVTQQLEEFRGVVAWYPPAGITYVLLLVFGARYTPAVTIALMISSVFIYRMPQPPYLLVLWACIISALYGIAAALLRKRLRFDWRLRQARDVTILVVTAVLLSALLAVLSVGSSALSSDLPQSDVTRAMFLWWIGETVGVLTVTPFLLIHVMPWMARVAHGQPVSLPARWALPRPTLAVIGQSLIVALTFYWVFGILGLDEFRPVYLIVVPLIWIALDHGLNGVTSGIVVLNFGVTLALWLSRFDLARLGELQLLMIVNCLVGLLMGAVVTNRKQAEQSLRESEAKLSAVFEMLPVGVSILDADRKVSYMNPALEKIMDIPRERLFRGDYNGRTYLRPDRTPMPAEEFASVRALKEQRAVDNVEIGVVKEDGDVIWTSVSAVPIAHPDWNMIIVTSDITERKRAEEALVEERNLLRVLMDNLPDQIYFKDAESRFTRINPAMALHIGLSGLAQAIGKTDFDFFTAEHAQQSYDDEHAIMESGEPLVSKDEKETWPDGRVQWVTTTKMPLRNHEGRIVGTFGVSHDITKRKQAEEKMQESERRIRTFLDSTSDMSYLKDESFRHIIANRALCTFYGKTESEIIGKTDFDLMTEKAAVACRITDEQSLLANALLIAEEVVDGRSYETMKFPVTFAENSRGIGAYIRDVTERRQAKEQIQRQLGYMSALHEIDLAIVGATDIRVALNEVLMHALAELKVDAATILLVDASGQTLKFAASRGFHSDALRHTHLRIGSGYAGQAALEQNVVLVPNLIETPDGLLQSPTLSAEGFVFYCAAPLIAKGHVVGVLEVFHRSPLSVDQEWTDFLEAIGTQAALAVDNARLFEHLQSSNLNLSVAYDATIEGWSRALDLRDKETEGHTQRGAEMTVRLATAMGVDDAALVQIRRGALLHDMGKIGIPDSILLKPGQLSDEEWTIMRKHPRIAYDMLSPVAYLRPALDIPYCHHERWDGTGYPQGLKGEQIPLAARIFAVLDVFDALTSDRPYRAAWPREKALEYVREQAGKHFDPQVVAAFLNAPAHE